MKRSKMGKHRSVLRALVMGFVPVLHIFLFWKFCNEAKVRWKLARLNSTVYAAMFLVPLLNVYPLFRFLSYVQANLGKNGKKAYVLPPLLLSALACSWILAVIPLACPVVLPISWLSWLYVVYMTQTLFNENGVELV